MAKRLKQKLPRHVVENLQSFFPEIEFTHIRISSGIPWPISLNEGTAGYTAGNNIYLRKDYFDSLSTNDIFKFTNTVPRI